MSKNKIIEKHNLKWLIREDSKIGQLTQDYLGPNDREVELFEFIEKNSNPDKIFVDIGAMVGGVSLRNADNYKKVYSFEPCHFNYQGLCRNIALNDLGKKVFAFNSAIGEESGTAFIPKKSGGTGSVSFENDEDKDVVPIFCLDDFSIDYTIGMIKIDTEGFEYEILKGARSIIKEERPYIILETHDFDMKGNRVREQTMLIIRFLEELDYEFEILRTSKNNDRHLAFTPNKLV